MTKEGTLYSEDRGCTDILFLLLFAIFWVGMVFVGAVAFANGHTERLTHGIDFEGNLCGVSGQPKQPSDATLQDPRVAVHGSVWTDRKYLWFPVTEDMSIDVIRKLGLCVNHCPQRNSSTVASYNNATQGWPVHYTSKPFFGRCLPILSESAGWENIKELAPALKAGEWLFDIFEYLVAAKWTLLACVGTAVALCFLWTFLLRWIITPLVYLSLLLVLGLLVAGAYGMWTYGASLSADESSPYHDYAKWWKVGAVVTAVVALLYVCLVVFLCKRINTAIDIIQLASKVINSVPSLWLVPILFLFLMILLAVWCIGVGALITTSDKLGTETVEVPAIPDVPGREIGQRVEVTFLQSSRSPLYMELYYVFGFLWTSGFFSAFAFMIVAFCGVFWYFSIPGDSKYSPTGAVLKAAWWTLRYHVGTLAFGSLVVAVIQFIRFLLQRFEKQIKAASEGAGCGRAASFCVCCCQCCLACFERLVKFINQNAYIVTCIQGANFCSACAEAIRLLVSNVLRVGAVNFISDWVMIFMKALITLSNVGIGWLFLHHVSALKPADEINDFAPLLFIGFFTYIIASIFMHIFATLIDTILLCFCYDEDVNNGSDRPYYMTTDLQDLINKHNQTGAIAQAAKQQTSYST